MACARQLVTVVVLMAVLGCGSSSRPGRTRSDVVRLRGLVDETKQSTAAAVASYKPAVKGLITDLRTPAEKLLRYLPGVVEVECHAAKANPLKARIIHLRDWHYLPRETFAADIRSATKAPIPEAEEIDCWYEEHLLEVELVQTEQLAVLRCLIKHHGLKRVFAEGLTEEDMPVFREKLAVLRKVQQRLAGLRKKLSELDDGRLPEETAAIREGISRLSEQSRRDALQIGAAGQLLLAGEIEEILPLEDAAAFKAVNPVGMDGVNIDQQRNEAREDAHVRKLLDSGPVAVVILGGTHDLADNVKRLDNGGCEYVRVTMSGNRRVAKNWRVAK